MIETMDHDAYLELLAGATLEDLDPSERERLEAHRAGCARCAEAEVALDETIVALASAVPQRRPSPGLEARIMAAVAAEPRVASETAPAAGVAAPSAIPATTTRAPAPADRVAPAERRTWTDWFRRPVFAMAAAGLAIVLAVASLSLAMQTSSLQSTLALQDAAIAVLADPAHVVAPLEPEAGTTGVSAMAVFVPGSTESYVMATGLAPTPAGEVYQLWSADAAGVHPLGTFAYDGTGTFVAPFGVDLGTAAAAMITIEPTGGATGEPGPQVVFGELPPPST